MAVEIGEVAPDFMLRDDGNNEVRLSDLRGRNVVLVFYPLDFSPVCTRELKHLSATRERYAAAGAEILGISVDSRYVHGAFRRDEQLEVRLLADFHPKGGVARAYGAYLERPASPTGPPSSSTGTASFATECWAHRAMPATRTST